MSSGKLIVISGASGVGKGTVLGIMMQKRSDLSFSVSATTRAPRPDETDGVNYHFITRKNFLEMVHNGEFLEYDEHHNNLYGTLYSAVKDATQKGHVVLDIEPNGAMNVRNKYPDAILIFIMPPSWEDLEARLRGRGDTSEEQVQIRLERARWEIEQAPKYDYQVVNDVVDTCVEKVLKIIADKAD